MNRRTFLSGSLLGVSGLVASIGLQSKTAAGLLVPNHDVHLYQPNDMSGVLPTDIMNAPTVYIKHNQHYVPVGIATSVTYTSHPVDVTSGFDREVSYIEGIRSGEMTVTLLNMEGK